MGPPGWNSGCPPSSLWTVARVRQALEEASPHSQVKGKVSPLCRLTEGRPCVSVLTDPPTVKTCRSLSKKPLQGPRVGPAAAPTARQGPPSPLLVLTGPGTELMFFKKKNKHTIQKKKRPEREGGEPEKNMPRLWLGAWHHHPPRACFLRMEFCWFAFQRLPEAECMSSGEQGRGLSPVLHRTPNALLLQAP